MFCLPQYHICTNNCPCALQLVWQPKACSLPCVLNPMPNPASLLEGFWLVRNLSLQELHPGHRAVWLLQEQEHSVLILEPDATNTKPFSIQVVQKRKQGSSMDKTSSEAKQEDENPIHTHPGFSQQKHPCSGVWHMVQAQNKQAVSHVRAAGSACAFAPCLKPVALPSSEMPCNTGLKPVLLHRSWIPRQSQCQPED